jgi:hypothetical protein
VAVSKVQWKFVSNAHRLMPDTGTDKMPIPLALNL